MFTEVLIWLTHQKLD